MFIGQIADIKSEPIANIQNYKEGLTVLDVKKSWKGVKKEFIAIDLDFDDATTGGMCSLLYKFEQDQEYLVFAYEKEKELKVTVECSDTRKLESKYDWTAKEISKLDSFWFRTKSRLWRL